MKKMGKNKGPGDVWVFGDFRNYFQNRVTLQLIAKGKELAAKLGTEVAVVVLGDRVHQYAMEYVAHGADVVIAGEHPGLAEYQVETYTALLAEWVDAFEPEIFLGGATSFGREFFPRLAKRLRTGLSADCVALEIVPETGLLLQTTPAFGGELLAEVVTPDHRPQMATVHPGVFQELPHDAEAMGRIIYQEVDVKPELRVKLVRSRPQETHKIGLEDAPIVVAGGRGLGDSEQFKLLFDLAELLGGEVGATRPAVTAEWVEEERLLGQTGMRVKPRLLISVGTSGALQYTTGIEGAETIIAINRDPHAPIFKMADLGLVGDAATLLPLLLEELRKRL
ncbi:MAG: electron transfer flavoprotein subunit alpha/FixB family protein [Deltaproteobacteria bacterium]|nr:electron transfer flavoprotein subunit alpha/FixB family protein [Deltaproteobacteria bacterium]